ncbi:MAG: TonB-dependent receptor [Flavobacteriaceae bacterium]|nr:TonB-dependent receptor [Flavobacteriaceae bacterium]
MRFKLTLIALLFFQIAIAQKNEETKLTIEFTNINKLDFISKIESKTSYKFFYLKKWIDSIPVSGKYNNERISTILDDVFEKTTINYHITEDKRIVLTNNVLIHTTLPIELLSVKKEDIVTKTAEIKKPILYVEPQNVLQQKTIRIGKEVKNAKRKRYTISGYVYNKQNNKPIVGLVLSTKNKNTITDSLGYYSLRLTPGYYEIKTKAIGIKDHSQKVVIYNNGKLNFNLEDSSEILDEVVINAEADKNIREVATSITEFKVEEVKTIPLVLGERDILKVAATLPGIKTAGEGSSGYSVRGGKTDQNLILLDDGVVYNPTHFFGIFSAVNPFTTGKVKIFKGSAPSEYGGRLSSVFDIKTKDGDLNKFKGEASIGPVTSNITLETPIKKEVSSLIFGARGTYSNWILKSLDDTSLDNSSASFYDVIAKYKHKVNDKNNIEATGYYSYDDYKITSDSLHSYSNRLFSLKWNKTINEKHNGSLLLANSQYKFDIEYRGGADSDFDLGYKLNETHLKLKMQYRYNPMHHFDYGVSSKLYIINPGSKKPNGSTSIVKLIEVEQEKSLESALFITDNVKLNDNFSFDAGLRYSLYASLGKGTKNIYQANKPKNESTIVEVKTYANNEVIKTYSGLEIRTSARYKFNPTFSIKGSYNNTFQYIQSLSNNTTASPTDTWRLSGLNIKPQESKQVTLGLYKNYKENVYEFSVEGYYKLSNNILDYKVGADLLINPNVETEVLQGKGKAYGVEFLIKKNEGKLNGWLGYTYSRSFSKFDGVFSEERINGGEFFPSNIDKPHDVSLVANYKMTKRFSWSFNLAYQTGRPVTYPVGKYTYNGNQYVYYSEHNKYRIPDYFRLDLGLNIEGNHRIKKFAHSFWNISVYNILGRNNPYSVFFVTKDGQINAYKSTIFSVPVPTITYNFKF